MLADLQGQIERITYTNDENGYTIAKVKVYGHREKIPTIPCGNLLLLSYEKCSLVGLKQFKAIFSRKVRKYVE